MSRLEKHAQRSVRKRIDAAKPGNTGDASGNLPSRRIKYPSNKQQMTNWFYNALIVLFIMLVAALFYFGKQLSDK